jgi:hypothetical protein
MFNRLDKVDDMEERVESGNVKLWQYMFVSCWTENPEESIPLWRMYSGDAHGVRVGMDIDMFEERVIDSTSVPQEIPTRGTLISKIPAEDLFNPDFTVMPITTRNVDSSSDSLFYCHVSYVDDVKEKTKDVFQLKMTDATHADSNVAFGEIGKYKNKRWAFQEETRFRLLFFPFNPFLTDPDMITTVAVNSFLNSKPIPKSEYFLKLREDVLDKIEITLHPNSTSSDKVIVEALCNKYAEHAVIKESQLKDRVKLK